MSQTNIPIEYSQKLLQANTTALFITIPQTTYDYTILHAALAQFKHTKYLITKLEQHEDKGLHIHVLIQLSTTIRISSIHKIIQKQEGIQNGLIDYQKPKSIQASIAYIKKVETSVEGKPYLEHGEQPKQFGRQPQLANEELLLAIEKAEQGDVDGAMEDIKHIDPMKYIQYKEQIKTNLKTENKQRKKYTAPDMTKQNIKLNSKQEEVWNLLQSTPKARRIIWVSGQYGSGKSFLMNYIQTNHEYQLFNAGQTANLDNIAHTYDEEGVIAWDLPRTFNFTDYGDAIANVIEKFSDFGQSITSKKYNGKTQQILGHVLVFSNHPPINQLKHRDIVHIDLSLEIIEEVKQEEVKQEVLEPMQVNIIEKEVDSDPENEYFNEQETTKELVRRYAIRHQTNDEEPEIYFTVKGVRQRFYSLEETGLYIRANLQKIQRI